MHGRVRHSDEAWLHGACEPPAMLSGAGSWKWDAPMRARTRSPRSRERLARPRTVPPSVRLTVHAHARTIRAGAASSMTPHFTPSTLVNTTVDREHHITRCNV